MDILITNDDGYFAPGIKVLKHCLQKLGHNCTVIAPQTQKSAVSSALTLFEPIFLYENSETSQEYYISGTPVDCVKIALNQILKKKPDLLISGVNQGANIGINVTYSGTVAAAFEGIFNHIPAIAVSLDSNHAKDFEGVELTLKKLLKKLLQLQLPKESLWNVNIPAIKPSAIQGVRFTTLSKAFYEDNYERRTDLRGRSYFWLGENVELSSKKMAANSDSIALKEGFISITPLTFDMTDFQKLEGLPQVKW